MLRLSDGSLVELRERSGFSSSQTGERSHGSPGPRQHHRAGRQAALRPPLCRHGRLPRGRHRHGFRRQRGRQGLARFRDGRRSARDAGQSARQVLHPGDQAVTSDRPGSRDRCARISPGAAIASAYSASWRPCAPASIRCACRSCATPAGCWAAARVYRFLCQHSQPGADIWAMRRRSSTSKTAESPELRAWWGSSRPRRRPRCWKSCAPPANIWATRSSLSATTARQGRLRCFLPK